MSYPAWMTPPQYNDPADNTQARPPADADDGPDVYRQGPHNELLGLDDHDEADDPDDGEIDLDDFPEDGD